MIEVLMSKLECPFNSIKNKLKTNVNENKPLVQAAIEEEEVQRTGQTAVEEVETQRTYLAPEMTAQPAVQEKENQALVTTAQPLNQDVVQAIDHEDDQTAVQEKEDHLLIQAPV